MAKVITYNLTATTTEQYLTKGIVYKVRLLKNDGDADLYVGFNKSTTNAQNDYILLKEGEYMEDLNVDPFQYLYFKSASGNVSFRLYGESI